MKLLGAILIATPFVIGIVYLVQNGYDLRPLGVILGISIVATAFITAGLILMGAMSLKGLGL